MHLNSFSSSLVCWAGIKHHAGSLHSSLPLLFSSSLLRGGSLHRSSPRSRSPGTVLALGHYFRSAS